MPDLEGPNPYEPPQSASELPPLDPHRPIGVLGWLVIVPLTLLASAVAFCCSCVTLVLSAIPMNGGNGSDWVFWSCWVVAAVIAGAIGYFVARGLMKLTKLLRRRIES